MQKGRNMQYVTSGVQTAQGMRMNVRSNVRLPDSEAGGYIVMDQQPYYAEEIRLPVRGTPTVPMNAALIFLCALFVFFGVLCRQKVVYMSSLSKRISDMEANIARIELENEALAVEVEEARRYARISEAAERKCGMIKAINGQNIPVDAPNTRPFGNEPTVPAGYSPESAQDAMKLGSR